MNVGDETVLSILKFSAYSGVATLEELAHHSSNLKISNGKSRATLESFLDTANFQALRVEVQAEIDSFKNKGVEIVLFGTKTYPIALYGLPKPPPFLYCKGNLNLLDNRLSLAVVGTRENTPKGETITIKTIQKFATYGFTIVSGLALGIDTIAHRAALGQIKDEQLKLRREVAALKFVTPDQFEQGCTAIDSRIAKQLAELKSKLEAAVESQQRSISGLRTIVVLGILVLAGGVGFLAMNMVL
ncbi:TPA: hypothetical protein JLL88_000985 [Escherichia coli]|nr:hypothetical protein [Escherichia coli]HAW1348532.1 hypothetical protein [Escherichia coli]